MTEKQQCGTQLRTAFSPPPSLLQHAAHALMFPQQNHPSLKAEVYILPTNISFCFPNTYNRVSAKGGNSVPTVAANEGWRSLVSISPSPASIPQVPEAA